MTRRLNLGAGDDIRPNEDGWVNCDIRRLDGIDCVFDVTMTFPFASSDFGEILANDLIEHLPFNRVWAFLSECFRVLKPGGVLRLRLPDLPKIMRRAISGSLGWEEAVRLIHGDQSEGAGGIWGLHRHGYNATTIAGLLSEAGFVDVDVDGHPTEYNLYISARRPE